MEQWNIKVTYEQEGLFRELIRSYGFAIDERSRLFKENVIYASADRTQVTSEQLGELEKRLRAIQGVMELQNEYRANIFKAPHSNNP